MTKSILFFVTLLGLCYEACGAMLKGSGKVLQRPSIINSESQFDDKMSFLRINKENSLPPFSEGKDKNAFIQEKSYIGLSEEDKQLKKALQLVADASDLEAIELLEAFRRLQEDYAEDDALAMQLNNWGLMLDSNFLPKDKLDKLRTQVAGYKEWYKEWYNIVYETRNIRIKELFSLLEQKRRKICDAMRKSIMSVADVDESEAEAFYQALRSLEADMANYSPLVSHYIWEFQTMDPIKREKYWSKAFGYKKAVVDMKDIEKGSLTLKQVLSLAKKRKEKMAEEKRQKLRRRAYVLQSLASSKGSVAKRGERDLMLKSRRASVGDKPGLIPRSRRPPM